jgi:hypothetical protein
MFHDGKNTLCYYNSSLEKLAAFETRGSGNIEKGKMLDSGLTR